MVCYVMLCYVIVCYVMLLYVILCYVMLCYVILYNDVLNIFDCINNSNKYCVYLIVE